MTMLMTSAVSFSAAARWRSRRSAGRPRSRRAGRRGHRRSRRRRAAPPRSPAAPARCVVAAGAAEAQRVVDAGEARRPRRRARRASLVRSTLTPEKWAASAFRPISKMPRPNDEKCSSSAKTIDQHHERDQDHRVARSRRSGPWRQVGPLSREVGDRLGAEQPDRDAAVQREGADRDRERRQADVRDEEAVEGAAHAPTSEGDQRGSRDRQPASCAAPRAARCVRPTMLATDRSISPVMITSVIGSAISRIGAMSRKQVVERQRAVEGGHVVVASRRTTTRSRAITANSRVSSTPAPSGREYAGYAARSPACRRCGRRRCS